MRPFGCNASFFKIRAIVVCFVRGNVRLFMPLLCVFRRAWKFEYHARVPTKNHVRLRRGDASWFVMQPFGCNSCEMKKNVNYQEQENRTMPKIWHCSTV